MRAIKVILLTAFAVLGACAGQPDSQVCKTGITCPEGTRCAAVQQICIINDCGDGIVQASEACDDGNIEDGDGCAANCGSREVCGDNVLNAAAGEKCDDGNTTGGDGCASDCLSIEICGNGIRDVNEACDDGNTVPGDGCSGNCKSTEVCGNKIVDLGEKCDDGDEPGGCNPDCQGGTGCGDGAIDIDGSGNALEECDDGNGDNQDDCTDDCHLNSCGDGIIQLSGSRIEDCEPVGGIEDAVCNVDCTNIRCGDGKINNQAGEQCDLGSDPNNLSLNADNKDCTALCKINRCGDALQNSMGPVKHEDCDDGNGIEYDGCSTLCKAPMCSNGIVEMNEQCDDSNLINGDGCSALCKFEKCGDGLINNGEACDGTGTTTTVGTPGETVGCNIDCTLTSCGDGKVNKTALEECDDKNLNDSGDACRNSCKLNVCGDGSVSATELCDDNPPNTNNADGCTTSCTTPTCKNGILDMGEQCDDGNNNDDDFCLNTCVKATCGDGVKATFEECDAGGGNGPNNDCLPNCKLNVCGDGAKDTEGTGGNETEACDDGNAVDETVCPYGIATCTLCSGDCNTVESNLVGNVCGDGVSAAPEMCDDGNAISESSCPYGKPNGMCNVCNATCSLSTAKTGPWCGDGITASQPEVCDDRSPTQNCGRCNNSCSAGVAAAAPATGFIGASDNSGGNISDGDYFVISDGLVTVKFEFDKNATATDTNAVLVDVNTVGLTAQQVRDKVKLAFTAAAATKNLRISAANAGDTGAVLTNLRDSAIGNVAITRNGLGTNFFISGMSGGLAGDCPAGTPCGSDQDCRALLTGVGNCVSNVCQ